MSAKKSKTTSSQTTNQTATTTPNTPSWLQQPWQDYTGKVNDLMKSGQPLTTGPSELQQQAFTGAANLAPSQNFDWATQLGLQAGTAGANISGPTAQTGTTGYVGQGYQASGPAGGNTYQAAQGQGQGYNAQTYNPATGQAATGQAANAGQAQGYNPNLVDWSQFGVEGINVGPMAQASSRAITDLNLNDYLNAGLGDQITATQADYDATGGRVRAAQAGQAAMNGGARNSNNAVMQAITEGELSRAANTGIANVRANAYDQAGNLATNDLNRESSTSQFNAGQTNQGLLTQAQLDANRNNLTAQLGQAGLLANQGALNQAGQFNAGAQNDFSLANAGFQQQSNMANQAAQNQFGLANMDAQNQAGQFNAGAQNAASQFGANAQNQFGLANMDALNEAGQFNAGSLNQSQLDAVGRQDAASQFSAAAGNQANQFNAGSLNDASQFNAAAQNQNNQFNAGQQDGALERMLQSAGLLGNIGAAQGADQRANIGMQAELGGTQRDIANAQQQDQYAQLAMIQQLLGGVPIDAFTGQTMNSNGTQSGKSSSTQIGASMSWNPATGFSFGG